MLGLVILVDVSVADVQDGGRGQVIALGWSLFASTPPLAAASGVWQGGPSRHKGADAPIPGEHGADGAALPPSLRPRLPWL